ncbi:2'-5' RNA ligase [Mesorhizobium sp. M7A.F.Ca.CA.001.09.2.1]|uniref:2'-5' RNA ligase family protein n=2 Tax=Mesorhizobium TaxID=68287 RepID=A0AB38T9E3_9HYPH|nr:MULTISPECIES: 2'-5' RNA ligase family protein [Mesorhizobium]RVA70752.1 2'-5' RNA ligase [Mesorhizobium sp. M7A.F.Ca.CA.001.11.2.1]MDF3153509.1 2'-5' RNA ligase family protein [Mesorhizobium sp. XAP10]MDF3213911.1 2'-5' RNA ligase family protein [Mesorhizobium ciceri]MDF3246194.1 2'-5' RNA ligase family protein [Mesorhizobium sp. XAP4]RUY71811.1 2'-5' RNA ligase [Mesorhizobium sp. M7A.F.Ca.CA.001.13.1.1]
MNELPTFNTAENGQTSFNWHERNRRRRTDRLFFCHLMDGTIADPIALQATAWRQELGLKGKTIADHISLVGLGDHDGLPEGLVELAHHIGSMIVAKPFDVSFDRLCAFGGGALVLRNSDGNPSLQEFWRNLTAVISDSPLKLFLTKSIEPHVTLLRDKVGVPKIRERAIEPISWTVRDFALVQSFIQEGRYEVPHRWQLTGQDDARPAM